MKDNMAPNNNDPIQAERLNPEETANRRQDAQAGLNKRVAKTSKDVSTKHRHKRARPLVFSFG